MHLNTSKIYFLGIGGIGMSGLAELLHNMGAEVWGSDINANANTEHLKNLGIPVIIGHSPENIKGSDVVVYSSAVTMDHLELQAARKEKVPVIRRAEVLAEVMRLKRGIAVGGTHGKTTTTSLIASSLIACGLKPTVVVGGRLDLIKSTSLLGEGEWLVAEADESDGSFLKLKPELAVITNIDNDHMDYYQDEKTLEKAFVSFAESIPFYGKVIACGDDERILKALEGFPKNVIYYGFNSNNDYQIKGSNSSYKVFFEKEEIATLNLNLPGKHNALNALAAFLVAKEVGGDLTKALEGLSKFSGVGRRFENVGTYRGAEVYDDYAHHPTEIRATIEAFREKFPTKKIKLAFQPHRFSRTKACWEDLKTCFSGVDELYLLPVYPAGEKALEGVDSKNLLNEISLEKKRLFDSQKEVLNFLKESLGSEDLFITFGAGDISKLNRELIKNEN